jgi:hypothetical protein
MSISVKLEYWNEAPDADSVHVITHCRKKFYNGKDITWYEFVMDGIQLHELGHENIIPKEFVRVPDTDYYEFGGTTENAINNLTQSNFTLIVKGEEL